jgi:hypothetical protein
VGAVIKDKKRSCFLLGTGSFWQISTLAFGTAVQTLVYSAEEWAFALIHSDLETRGEEVMHSRDKGSEKSCERATRMSSNILHHKPHRDILL